ncbi:hypothetical protein [Elioraea rosea]|nr:hypothetical protein [Elioraea rosea]
MEHGRAQEGHRADKVMLRLQRVEKVLSVLHKAAVTALALASLWFLLR